jgi:MarR family transcriptional regulator, organic hydroperoxide resistance regulator
MVLCDSLGKRGWLKRASDPADRRMNRLFLTEAGRRAYAEARERLQTEDEEMAGKLQPEELNWAIARLEILHDAMRKFLNNDASTRTRETGGPVEPAGRS